MKELEEFYYGECMPDGDFPPAHTPKHPSADVAVPGPRYGHADDGSSEPYSGGGIDLPPPEWLVEEAKRFRAERETRQQDD